MQTLATTNRYDANDRLIQAIDADGTVSETRYDAAGRAVWADDPHRQGQPATTRSTTLTAASVHRTFGRIGRERFRALLNRDDDRSRSV